MSSVAASTSALRSRQTPPRVSDYVFGIRRTVQNLERKHRMPLTVRAHTPLFR